MRACESARLVTMNSVNSESFGPSEEQSLKLRAPFDSSQIQKVNKRGQTLSYISHPSVRDRLNSVDPTWSIVPVLDYTTGRPLEDRADITMIPIGAWFKLTVCGVTKWGYGSYDPSVAKATMDAIKAGTRVWTDDLDPDWRKKVESDALSRAAMNFGVGLQLWSSRVTLESQMVEEEIDYTLDGVKNFVNSGSVAVKAKAKELLDGRKIADLDDAQLVEFRDALVK